MFPTLTVGKTERNALIPRLLQNIVRTESNYTNTKRTYFPQALNAIEPENTGKREKVENITVYRYVLECGVPRFTITANVF